MTRLPPIKRGDTFYIRYVSKDANGVPNHLSNFQIRTQARSTATKKLVAEHYGFD